MKLIDKIMVCLIFGMVIASHIETKKKLDTIKEEIEVLNSSDKFFMMQFTAQSRINEMMLKVFQPKPEGYWTTENRTNMNWIPYVRTNIHISLTNSLYKMQLPK